MINQYKPSKPQKVKPAKPAKAPKAPKAPKPQKAKAISFGKPGKVQADKPIKVGKSGKLSGFFEKVDPKIILGAALALIAVIAVIVLTVVLPAIEKHGQQIKSVSMTKTPDKTVYLVGEEADYDGLRLTVTRNNGETFTVRAGDCEITGFDSSAVVDGLPITVSYHGFSMSYFIKVTELSKPAPILTGIKLETLPKTQYKMGEWLDTTGGVILREYKDGSISRINLTNQDVFGFEAVNAPGTYTLTVKYKEAGIIAQTTYTITVTK